MIEIADLIAAEIEQMKQDGTVNQPHEFGQFVQAAKCYLDHYKIAIRRDGGQPKGWLHPNWPRTWDRAYWQPDNNDAQRNVVVAMALLQLEYDRLQELRRSVLPHNQPVSS